MLLGFQQPKVTSGTDQKSDDHYVWQMTGSNSLNFSWHQGLSWTVRVSTQRQWQNSETLSESQHSETQSLSQHSETLSLSQHSETVTELWVTTAVCSSPAPWHCTVLYYTELYHVSSHCSVVYCSMAPATIDPTTDPKVRADWGDSHHNICFKGFFLIKFQL